MSLRFLFLLLAALQCHSLAVAVTSSMERRHYMEKRSVRLQQGNTGNEFYLGFMKNYVKPAFQNIDKLIINRSTIFITTTDPSGAVIMIESAQGTSTHNVRPGQTVAKTLQRFKVQSSGDRDKGVKIKAEQLKQISVFAINEEIHSLDGFTALPCNRLPSVRTYEYYAVSVPPSTTSRNTATSAFLVVACSDDTRIVVTPNQPVLFTTRDGRNGARSEPITITLGERETFYVRSRGDLTGSKIESTAPISFFTGHECGNVPANTAECDHLVEQIPPTVTWGKQFIIAPTARRRADDIIKVVASEDNTKGSVSCKGLDGGVDKFTLTFTGAGTFQEFNLPFNKYCFLETDKPVLAVQMTPGGSADRMENGDPFMVIVPAISQYLENTIFSTVTGLSFDDYINLFVHSTKDAVGRCQFNPSTVVMDGAPIILNTSWVIIPDPNNITCGYAVQVAIGNGVHSLSRSDGGPLGVTVYGFSYRATYAYVGGLKLSTPGSGLELTPTSHFVFVGDSICMPCQSGDETSGRRTGFDWSKEKEFVLETQRRNITSSGSLCITNASMSDAGNYTCHVSGLTFPSKLSVIGGIIVEPPACGPPDSESPDNSALVGIGQGTSYLDSKTESLQICCRVQGPPGYTVTWLRDRTPISRRMKGFVFGDNYIRYTGPLHQGCVTYTCRVNFAQQKRVISESSEICVGNISPPTNVTIAGNRSVLEHSSVSYQCSADGFPAPTKMWTAYREMKDPLPQTARDDGSGTLTISDVTENDGRLKYCCDVGNAHGDILSDCIMINVLVPPELVKDVSSPLLTITVPFGATLPLEKSQNVTLIIGQNIMIPETYTLKIECKICRANPKASISWFRGDEMLQGLQYTIQDYEILVIKNLVKARDDGVYRCVAITPIGRDGSTSNVIITKPPQINSSDLVNSPGNCLDLTQELVNTQQVGQELCVRAGEGATLTLQCEVLEGTPPPTTVKWLKDGRELAESLDADSYKVTAKNLTLYLPTEAYGKSKQVIEGNYTCTASNLAGIASVSSDITLFGDILMKTAMTDFVRKQVDVYHHLHKAVSEHFPGVQDGDEHLAFFTSGKVLTYKDFNPGHLYDQSEESVLPQTMENIFDLVDIIPDGGSIVFNPHESQRLQETYSKLVEMLHVAPSTLSPDEQQTIRSYLQATVLDLGSSKSLPRLSLYLLYKNTYYMTKIETENLVDSQRQHLLGWEFTRWYERNIHSLQMKINTAYMKWEMYADKTAVEEKLDKLNLEDHSQDINFARALLLTSQRMSRFKDEKKYYLIKLYPDTWYKGLKNRVQESIEQMQFKMAQLKTEIQILKITSEYLDKETRKRDALNALFPSLDPVYQLYCDLDVATYKLEETVKEAENMRYECLITGNPANCHLYWNLHEHIREQLVGNYTEFFWYVHRVEAALNHREYSIPAISSTINYIQERVNHIQTSIDVALADLSGRELDEANDDVDTDFFTDFMYKSSALLPGYDFELPSSLIGRLLWYINPTSTTLLPKELVQEYNLTINHLNTAVTNVSAKFSKVNIHRRWFKAALFGNKYLKLVSPDEMVSPGDVHPPEFFREVVKNGTYRLPLYPSSLLLATDIQLTVGVPFVFHTLPTLIKLSYDPHISGGFGPFSFGPLHKASAGNMKFRVGITDNKITITIPATQLIGYVCDVVPQHPKETVNLGRRRPRSVYNFHDALSTESEFDQWLFSKKSKELPLQEGLFHKDFKTTDIQTEMPHKLPLDIKRAKESTESLAMLITPTIPLETKIHVSDISVYYNTTL